MNRNALSAICLACALAGVFAATAAGDPPAIVEQSFHRTALNFISCPGFTLAGYWDINRTVFTSTDNAGMPIRQVLHVHFAGTLTNTTTGKSIPDEGNFIVTTDLTTGTTTVVGGSRLDTVPGLGLILAVAGRSVTDAGNLVFIAGRQDYATKIVGGGGARRSLCKESVCAAEANVCRRVKRADLVEDLRRLGDPLVEVRDCGSVPASLRWPRRLHEKDE